MPVFTPTVIKTSRVSAPIRRLWQARAETSTHQRISTHQHVNPSTHQHINTSTHQRIKLINASTQCHQHSNTSQCLQSVARVMSFCSPDSAVDAAVVKSNMASMNVDPGHITSTYGSVVNGAVGAAIFLHCRTHNSCTARCRRY